MGAENSSPRSTRHSTVVPAQETLQQAKVFKIARFGFIGPQAGKKIALGGFGQ
jgi:hypothetical protein